jgi:general secretion pathway protein F
MPVYEYKGFDASGKAVNGIVDADNGKVARSRLRQKGLFPTDVYEQTKEGGASRGKGLNREIDFTKYTQFITTRDIANTTKQLSILLGASVPMAESLTALVDQTDKQKLKVILSEVKEDVVEGATLADALKKHPKLFGKLYVQMVRAGERSGALDTVLKRLSQFSEGQVKLQGQLIAALAYPLLMSVVGTLMIGGLFLFVVPQMREILDGLGGGDSQLPLISRAVFLFGDILTSPWILVIIAAIVGAVFAFRWWSKTEPGRFRIDGWKLKTPVLGRLNRMVAVSRFCRTLSTLLASGVPIISALHIVRDVVGNTHIAQAVDDAAVNIQEGHSIAKPLRASGQFPPMVVHMVTVGERTGELETMLTSIADAYEDEVEAAMTALTSIFAPIMILILAGAVFFVALGLLLPLRSMTEMIR